MSAKSWLGALKEAVGEAPEAAPQSPREGSRKPIPTTVQKVRNPRDGAGCEVVVDINTARAPRDEEERRLVAAGWEPKERMGLLIWANPETGFYCSREVALLRLTQGPPVVSPYRVTP